jgi:F0F1-type ATP synthase membrane subunit b/b'
MTFDIGDIIWIVLINLVLLVVVYRFGFWNGYRDALTWATDIAQKVNEVKRLEEELQESK